MHARRIMLIAGEASGDTLAAELVRALQRSALAREFPAPLEFFGAGGPRMAAAGVSLCLDMTQHAVVGVFEVVKHYRELRGIFNQLVQLAHDRQPDAIILVDYPGFNLRFAQAIKLMVGAHGGIFTNWRPKIIGYVSPQIWAWHESRVHQIARDFDLLLSIFPFEKAWYAERVPKFHVEFIGHPLIDRYAQTQQIQPANAQTSATGDRQHPILFLPGSREGEIKKHLPVMLAAARRIIAQQPRPLIMVVPNDALATLARQLASRFPDIQIAIQIGNLAEALAGAEVAIASTGTVTLECAYFGVPTVAFYKTSWATYQAGRWLVSVKHLAMPNLLAGETVYPELIQNDFTSEKLACETLELLQRPERRANIQAALKRVIESLGTAGASQRAADAILDLF
jgi:lipid-A-disaccharide synthase